MNSRRSLVIGVALLALSTGGACDRSDPPRSPVLPAPVSPTPTFISRLTLSGPTTVDLGATAEFTVTAQLTDGTTRDVTAEVAWATDPTILAMSSPGRFAGRSQGETSLRAALAGLSATMGLVIVVQAGTYRLNGSVRDLGTSLPGATIVVDDEALGRTTIVTPDGSYKLFGVAGQTRITASKDGYRTTIVDQAIRSHQTVILEMVLSDQRPDIAGRYTATFTAATECSSLPAEARVRRYPATVTQGGPSVQVILDGDRFFMSGPRRHNQFTGTVEARLARLLIRKDVDYYYGTMPSTTDVFDRLTDGTFFGVHGMVEMTISTTELSGALNGTFGIYGAGPLPRPISECASSGHQLTLVR